MASRESTRRFHFLKEIASGGFGSVYLAKVMHADGFSRLAAIKLLHQRWSENAEIAQRMRDEARLLGWLRHRNIVDVIDLTTIGGRVAVIMEYLEAIDFKGAINHVADMGERMPPRVALEATAFVASALDAAYNRPPYQGERPLRVIHRDIKPSNIMVDESGTIKVLDFGVARADFDHRESHTQELQFGSVDYMPPERLFFEPETPYSDVYSLGATLYEMLALEKLGKAKGRPEKHAQFLADRLAYLRTRCDLDSLSGEAVIELIREMCAYNHEGRPSAAEATQRCRALSRGFEGEGLTEWAERVIPPLVKASREAPREPNPLTDSILSEDSVSFKAEDTFVDPVADGVVLKAEDSIPSRIPGDDARWEMLRQAAISEMQGKPVAGPATAFVDGPTVVGREEEVVVIDDTLSEHAETTSPGEPLPFSSEAALPVSVGAPQPLPPVAPAAPAPVAAPAAPAARPVPFPAASRTFPPLPPAAADEAPQRPGRVLAPTATIIPDDEEEAATTVRPVSTAMPRPTPPSSPAPSTAARPAQPAAAPAPTNGAPAPGAAPPQAAPQRAASPTSSPPASARPQPAPSRPEPRPAPVAVAPDPFEDPPPPKRSLLIPIVVAFVALFALAGLGTVAFVGWSWYASQQVATPVAAVPAPVATSGAAATMAQDPVVPATVAGGLNFVSKAPDTAKITVTCDGKELTGAESVGVDMPSAQKCAVRVILKDRSRLLAQVEGATAGTYTCFDAGGKECTR